jgi:hypothetical protein
MMKITATLILVNGNDSSLEECTINWGIFISITKYYLVHLFLPRDSFADSFFYYLSTSREEYNITIWCECFTVIDAFSLEKMDDDVLKMYKSSIHIHNRQLLIIWGATLLIIHIYQPLNFIPFDTSITHHLSCNHCLLMNKEGQNIWKNDCEHWKWIGATHQLHIIFVVTKEVAVWVFKNFHLPEGKFQ